MNILFIADPMATFKTYKDTTYAMMREIAARGWQLRTRSAANCRWPAAKWWPQRPRLNLSAPKAMTTTIGLPESAKAQKALHHYDAVIMRTDPPFDMQYLYATQLLTLAAEQGAKVFNSGQAMRDFNEKLAILNFSRFTASTLVSTRSAGCARLFGRRRPHHREAARRHGRHGHFPPHRGRPQYSAAVLETLMQLDTRTIMAQRYIPEIVHGDKRVLVIGGEVVPFALARIPQNGETRGNLAAGGRGVAQELSARDREIAEALAPELVRRGILLAGLDIIGDCLTEVNVTSPTGFQEIMKQKGFDVAAHFADAVAPWAKA